MVFVGRSAFEPARADWAVYHTGPDAATGAPGEMRKASLADLRQHPVATLAPGARQPRVPRGLPTEDSMSMHWPGLRPGVTAVPAGAGDVAGRHRAARRSRRRRRGPPIARRSRCRVARSSPAPASPYVTLTFERLGSLDFRIYRVADPVAFFAGLDDAHTLGSEEYTVPTEQTWLERLASWKAGRRADLQSFLRRQVSREYRAQRRAGADKATVQRRVQLGLTAYAQVPLLNDKQVVASWREILPRLADTDVRRIPIEVKRPGVYLVEAVTGAQLAYTILMVSDVALVTKVAPGTMLAYLVDRAKGQPVAGCSVAAIADKVTLGTATTDARGLAAHPARRRDRRRPDHRGPLRRPGGREHAADVRAAVQRTPRTGRACLHRPPRLPAGPHGEGQGDPALAHRHGDRALRSADGGDDHQRPHRTRDPSCAPRRRRLRRGRHRGGAARRRRARDLHASR